jgi:sodium/potassium/calcium exchanger 6
MIGTAIAGAAAAVSVMKLADDGSSGSWRVVRCFCGFTCSMVWIAAIANEVVGLLLAVGEILGLSEAIIGLTSEFHLSVADQSSRWAIVSQI